MSAAMANVGKATGALVVIPIFASTMAAFKEFVAALAEVATIAGVTDTVRAAVAYSMTTVKHIVGRAIAEVSFAGGAFFVFTKFALSMTAGHFKVIAFADISATNQAIVVFPSLTLGVSAGARIMLTYAEITAASVAGVVLAFLAGIVTAS